MSLRQHPKYRDPVYGTITGEAFTAPPVEKSGPMKDGAMNFGGPIKAKGNESVTKAGAGGAVPVKAGETSKGETAPAKSKAVETKKPEEVKVKQEPVSLIRSLLSCAQEQDAGPSQAVEPSKAKPRPSKKRVITSDDEAEEDVEPDVSISKDAEPAAPMVKVETDDQAAMEAMMGMDMELSSPKKERSSSQPHVRKRGPRKTKMIVETVKREEKGYMGESRVRHSHKAPLDDVQQDTSAESSVPRCAA